MPACFSELRFYENWRAALMRSPDKHEATVCDDCLPSYQLAMKRAGRCANPDAVFKFDADGAIVGMGAAKDAPQPKEKEPEKVKPIRRRYKDADAIGVADASFFAERGWGLSGR